MRAWALSCALLAALTSLGAAQNFYSPAPPSSRGPPPQRTGPVGFTGIPLARFPGLDGGSSGAPQAFRASTPVVDDDSDDDGLARNVVTASPGPLFVSRPPQPSSQAPVQYRRPAPAAQHPVPARAPQPQQQQQRRPQPPPQRGGQFAQEEALEEEELEEEKPDKLSLLLPQSKFDCNSRKTGYYADDGLNCEVFHYCQDNVRHSWICPEGFVFHQVHLICMPPSGDNICKQSSQFHFVNDYLYRPINTEEAQSKPNVTLRYSDRYYPDNYYEEGEEKPERPYSAPAPAPVAAAPPRRPVHASGPLVYRQPAQVFHSPEEVNIPLVQRRPHNSNQRVYQQQQQQQQHDDELEYDDTPYRG